MKHIFINTCILLASMCLAASCDFLDENNESNITGDNFYRTLNDSKLGVPSVALQFNGAFNQTWGATYGSDDMTSQNAGNKIGFHDVDVFAETASNDRIVNWWKYFYSTINVANSIIINTEKYGVENSNPLQKNLIGVTYFYRAMSYFFLTRTWGEVPLVLTDPLVMNKGDVPNSSVADIYTEIVADMKKAEEMLPVKWEAPYYQNGVNVFPTVGAAKAALANIYLTMAGWPLKKTEMYALAAQKAKEVIDNKDKYGYKLEEISQLWKLRFTQETVFGCYYNINIAGGSWENGSQLGPKSFGCAEEGDWQDGYAELKFYRDFPEGPRKEATFQKDYIVNKKMVDYTHLAVKHPFFLKYRYDNYDWTKHKSLNWWGSATVPVIRYAEVLLTYAEAQAQSAGPDASAYNAINQVRQRAGLEDLQSGLSKDKFIEAVIAERGWEFAGPEPAARWFDLVRTEQVAKFNKMRDPAEWPIEAKNMPDDKTHKGYWMPIPVDK